EIGKRPNRAIGEETVGGRRSSKRLRRSHSLSHNADSRKIDSIKDLVHERNIHLTGADSVERVEDTVFLNIHVVERMAEETLCTFVPNPADIETQAARQLALDRQIETLNVRRLVIVRISGNTRRAASATLQVERHRLKRHHTSGGQREHALIR